VVLASAGGVTGKLSPVDRLAIVLIDARVASEPNV
jgi:hypothetical protein